jgi:hypothetical protein
MRYKGVFKLKKFMLNEGYQSDERMVEAEWYETVGDFVDFFVKDASAHGGRRQIFRIRATEVATVELKS